MTYSYAPKGVCSSRIDLELEGDIIKSVQFTRRLQREPPGNFPPGPGHEGGGRHCPAGGYSLRLEAHQLPGSAQPCPAGGTGPGGPLRGWKMPGDAVLRMMKER